MRRFLPFVVLCLILSAVASGCGSEVKNPTTAGEEEDHATKEYHKQVDQGERAEKKTQGQK